MATAIEYGLIAALIAVGGITVVQGVSDKQVIATNVTCTAREIDENGSFTLDCPQHRNEASILFVNDRDLALAQALRPRPMTCTLYRLGSSTCTLRQ